MTAHASKNTVCACSIYGPRQPITVDSCQYYNLSYFTIGSTNALQSFHTVALSCLIVIGLRFFSTLRKSCIFGWQRNRTFGFHLCIFTPHVPYISIKLLVTCNDWIDHLHPEVDSSVIVAYVNVEGTHMSENNESKRNTGIVAHGENMLIQLASAWCVSWENCGFKSPGWIGRQGLVCDELRNSIFISNLSRPMVFGTMYHLRSKDCSKHNVCDKLLSFGAFARMIRLNDASNHVSTSQGIPRTVSVVVPATLVAIGIAIFCMVIFSITSMHMVLSPAMGAVAEYSKDMKMDAFKTAQTRTLNQLYEDNYVIISAPPVSVCQSEFQTNTIACMWYPIVLKWYKIISSGPRFFIYNYTLGGAFSVNNFGIFQATNFPSMTRPWDYFQAIALLAAPALGIAIAAVIMGLLFYLGCSLTCCCCCCGKGFGCGKKKMSFGTKLAAKLCMLAVAVVVSFGLFLEFSGYTLWRQAITDFFDILIKEITFANDKSKELQVQLERNGYQLHFGPASRCSGYSGAGIFQISGIYHPSQRDSSLCSGGSWSGCH